MNKILIIEPFYGGSHKQMIDVLTSALNQDKYELVTMTAKKWPWRARCSSLYISQNIPDLKCFTTMFCSSVLNLAELVGLCPKMSELKKIIYFHENQLIYPVKTIKERDYQYGYNQITSCLAADVVIFNSHFNMTSFLGNIKKFIKMLPDYRLQNISQQIENKCLVLYFPMCFKIIDELKILHKTRDNLDVLHIVWAHRWEFDKNPILFFDAMYHMLEENVNFEVSILGESFSEIPKEFGTAKIKLEKHLKNYGFVESQQDYYKILLDADIVISTADHEFFGVSMLEGVRCGCVPLAPNNLVYPELYPAECLYNSKEELFSKIKTWCKEPKLFAEFKSKLKIFESTDKFNALSLLPQYLSILISNNTK